MNIDRELVTGNKRKVQRYQKDVPACPTRLDEFITLAIQSYKKHERLIRLLGRGSAILHIGPRYVCISCQKGDYPICSTGDIPTMKEWCKHVAREYPEFFSSIVQTYIMGKAKKDGSYGYSNVSGNIVYFVGSDGLPFVKIGTTSDMQSRLNQLQTSMPYTLRVLFAVDGDEKEESMAHFAFKDYHERGEWYRLEGKFKEYVDYMSNNPAVRIDPWEFN